MPSASSVRRRLQRTCPGPAAVPSAPVCARGLKTGGKGVSEREMLTDPLVFNTSNSALLRETVSLGWFLLHSPAIFPGLPGWLSGKESAHQCRRLGIDPWVRKIPWSRKWQTTPVFLPGDSHGQGSLDTTEHPCMPSSRRCPFASTLLSTPVLTSTPSSFLPPKEIFHEQIIS